MKNKIEKIHFSYGCECLCGCVRVTLHARVFQIKHISGGNIKQYITKYNKAQKNEKCSCNH